MVYSPEGMQQRVFSASLRGLDLILRGPKEVEYSQYWSCDDTTTLPPIEALFCPLSARVSTSLPLYLSIHRLFVVAPFVQHVQVTRDPTGSAQPERKSTWSPGIELQPSSLCSRKRKRRGKFQWNPHWILWIVIGALGNSMTHLDLSRPRSF